MSYILSWECPRCKRFMTDLEHASARFDYPCPTKSCVLSLSMYHIKERVTTPERLNEEENT